MMAFSFLRVLLKSCRHKKRVVFWVVFQERGNMLDRASVVTGLRNADSDYDFTQLCSLGAHSQWTDGKHLGQAWALNHYGLTFATQQWSQWCKLSDHNLRLERKVISLRPTRCRMKTRPCAVRVTDMTSGFSDKFCSGTSADGSSCFYSAPIPACGLNKYNWTITAHINKFNRGINMVSIWSQLYFAKTVRMMERSITAGVHPTGYPIFVICLYPLFFSCHHHLPPKKAPSQPSSSNLAWSLSRNLSFMLLKALFHSTKVKPV